MQRRTWLKALAAVGAGAAVGWIGETLARACGTSVKFTEEEFFDWGPVGSERLAEVSQYWADKANAGANERFCVGPGGKVVMYASADGFCVRDQNGEVTEVPAPVGGRVAAASSAPALLLSLCGGSRYDRIVVVDAEQGTWQGWGDAYDLNQVVLSRVGMVVSHGALIGEPGRLSIVSSPGNAQERLRLSAIPSLLCAAGSQVTYFIDERAFLLDLASSAEPVALGRLPSPATAAVMRGSELIATTDEGAWLLSKRSKPHRLLAEPAPSHLFQHRGRVVVGSARRARIIGSDGQRTIEAPHANLHHVGPIEGSDDLVLCRGPSVLRYEMKTGRLTKIGQGRAGAKLRGATLVREQLMVWSSRTWAESDGGCHAESPPRTYLVE